MYLDSMRTLHATTTDPVEIIVWRDIYKYLEDCVDACEHTSDIVENCRPEKHLIHSLIS